jgi:hypothetical protein
MLVPQGGKKHFGQLRPRLQTPRSGVLSLTAMRWVLLSGVGAVLWVCAARAEGTASSYTFGGFSPGGREYWKRGPDDLVCEPAPSTTCRPIEKKDTRSFVKPPRGRKAGGLSLSVSIDEEKRVSLRGGERDLGSFAPGGRVVSVNANLFVAPEGDLVAVEYEVHDKGAKRGDVVVFDLRAAPAVPVPAATPQAGNAYDRAVAKGGVWEQRIVPCDVAGVTLKLQKTAMTRWFFRSPTKRVRSRTWSAASRLATTSPRIASPARRTT